MNTDSPVVLISGCSTGIGRALAMEFAARNWWVFATARKPAAINDLKARNVETAALDVTDEKSITVCVNSVIAKTGRIDILVNNAGLLLIGPLVELETSELRHQFETNVIGMAALIRAVAPYMIGRRSGKIVNISSVWNLLPSVLRLSPCSRAASNRTCPAMPIKSSPVSRKLRTVRYKISLSHGRTLRRKTQPQRQFSRKNSSINLSGKKRRGSSASARIRRCYRLSHGFPAHSSMPCSAKSSGLIGCGSITNSKRCRD